MRTQPLGKSDLQVTRIAYGCMSLGGSWDQSPILEQTYKSAVVSIRAALDQGINFFDHADIYCMGKSEKVFSGIWCEVPHLRQKIYLQSKCGIRFDGEPRASDPHRFDFSYQHILESVENSLKRLKTDYLDVLLLHRPDPLIEPEEVACAFDQLHKAGKVRYFGVSNHTPGQIELLRRYLDQPIVTNQVEYNLVHTHMLDEGIIFNQNNPKMTRNEGTFEYCRLHDITLQAWSPMARGKVSVTDADSPEGKYAEVQKLVKKFAELRGVSVEAVLSAWILRHPAKIQVVLGSTRPDRIAAACQGDSLEMTREEWFSLFTAGRGEALP